MADDIVHTRLRDGTKVCLRALRASDEARVRQGIADLSDRSRYLRFFSGAREMPPSVIQNLVNVDGQQHIAWGAIETESDDDRAIGACHAIYNDEISAAEFSIGVLDEYHSLGLSRILIARTLLACDAVGIDTLRAVVLAENKKALRLLKALGAQASGRDGAMVTLDFNTTTAISMLRDMTEVEGLRDVFKSV
jgi:RimJ/RimL family protein N-acetyltransferase